MLYTLIHCIQMQLTPMLDVRAANQDIIADFSMISLYR